jgi:hypothetical protein
VSFVSFFFLRYTLEKKGGVLAEREEIIGATGLSRTTRQRNITLCPSSSSDGVVSMGKEKIQDRPTTKTKNLMMMMTVLGLTVDGDSQTEVGR